VTEMPRLRKASRQFEHLGIGARLRALRTERGLSQGDIEKSTGLLRCYLSRLENGHSVPSLETLERLAVALGVPLYQIFYRGEEDALPPPSVRPKTLDELAAEPGKEGEEARFLLQLRTFSSQLSDPDREVLLTLARKLVAR